MTNNKWTLKWLLPLLMLVTLCGNALAVPPQTISYQAYLKNSLGLPVNATENVTFRLYDAADISGILLWSHTLSVVITDGLFSVELGTIGNPLPKASMDDLMWLGVEINTDGEAVPRKAFNSINNAFRAEDSDTLQGQTAVSLDQSAHVADTVNPHAVTAAQVGAASTADITTEIGTHTGDVSAHHAKTDSFVELSGQISDAQVPFLIARDAEIMPTVLASDGPGSTLNADLLDGLNSSAFMSSATDNWVNITGDTMTGALTVQGQTILGSLRIDSGDDIKIYDDFNGFRWYSADQTAQFGGFEINSAQNSFRDYNQARYVFSSLANGIGIGTNLPSAGFSVTMPSLDITGALQVGAGIDTTGTGSLNGLTLGSDQATAVNIYHTSTATRITSPGGRLQYGSAEYIEDCGPNCTELGGALNVTGNYVTVTGSGGEQAYIGGDGAGNDVQVGSANAAVTAVALWNTASSSRMDIIVRQIFITGGADIAEPFDVSDDIEIKPGMILSINPDDPGLLRVADKEYDRMVAGIVSGANGINPGITMLQEGTDAAGSISVALTGRVYALVDTRYGSIQPGDLLTTSNTPGYARKVTDYEQSQGSIIGKAMTSLKDGKGHVLVLVTLQ